MDNVKKYHSPSPVIVLALNTKARDAKVNSVFLVLFPFNHNFYSEDNVNLWFLCEVLYLVYGSNNNPTKHGFLHEIVAKSYPRIRLGYGLMATLGKN